ncbi:MAG: hypothetical protein UR28_C0029G0032 [Candidatus Peregrinibacteria bacterium GW2011_GWF2_33_10]|nr:MAG: hypothetical protein UR28_C0029G0032 [Candidatus Peregrinibacteria bacterium GW2011_GWF2_33_10]OGJ45419.1 MAG: hypothetical protein A2263_04090 [Candidatus Peregrinibacteria bacterium RIFOXYA2_FULL_33_21]OGJ45540.1 MAG: hypothetical protein A2272_01010 [Candidatus Peregrinibacteria bacterium RIFOXYA12_FULL_33_12]OGJ51022.1 MAG: hypothetical protein A2307_05685 [Candidatus Peregrinibacteria bacterium RIFOXYB2_FULL_33_20]
MHFKSHIIDLLQRIGLTHNEAKFYLISYQNPNATIKELQNKLNFSLATTYRIFEHLKELGLLISSQNNWRQNINVLSLKTLASKLSKEQKKLRKIELELQKVNNLMNLTNFNDSEDSINILTDKNQIIEHNYQILNKSWENMLVYGSAEILIDVVGYKAEHDFKDIRVRKGKKCNVILTEIGEYAKELVPNNEREFRNMKIQIDKNNQNYMFYIYDNEITIWKKDDTNSRSIIISEPDVIKIYKQMFDHSWLNAN